MTTVVIERKVLESDITNSSCCMPTTSRRFYIFHISIIARVAPHQLNLQHLMNQMVLLVIPFSTY
jgi:hypothetical protein